MILVIGEILFDVFPAYKRLGGAPFNFAFHLKNLGLAVRFVSRVGSDAAGKEIRQHLRRHDFRIEDIQVDDQHPTGKVLIELDERNNPDFDILPNVAYDHITIDSSITTLLENPIELIYFGTLIQRTQHGFENIHRILASKPPRTKCFYDVNLRPGCFSKAVIVETLRQTDILKLNLEELETIRQMLGFTGSRAAFAERLMEENRLDMLALTKGEKGSELFTPQAHYQQAPAQRQRRTRDTVGAGDAYAAILAVGYLQQWAPERILSVATEFAARICEIEGALPASRQFYQPYKEIMDEGIQ